MWRGSINRKIKLSSFNNNNRCGRRRSFIIFVAGRLSKFSIGAGGQCIVQHRASITYMDIVFREHTACTSPKTWAKHTCAGLEPDCFTENMCPCPIHKRTCLSLNGNMHIVCTSIVVVAKACACAHDI